MRYERPNRYTPAVVTGTISGNATDGLKADATVHPSVTVVNSGSVDASNVEVQCSIFAANDASKQVIGSTKGTIAKIAAGANSTAQLPTVDMGLATLWHTVDSPQLYETQCTATDPAQSGV